MTRGRRRRQAEPASPIDARLRAAMSAMVWVAAASIAGLALLEVTAVEAPLLRWVFMGGIVLAGTVAYFLQAQRRCASCGEPFGYKLRLLRSSTCPHCGADFPPWPGDRGNAQGN